MRTVADLFPYQVEALGRAEDEPELALFMEPGDGKTAVTLAALEARQAWPALVVAPAQVVTADVWGEEARAWKHLKHIEVVPFAAGDPQARRRQLGREPPRIEVVSYENLLWLAHATKLHKRYNALVFDELSKMKTPGAKRFHAMRFIVPRIPVKLGLTGTPVGNHLLDLWGEMFMVACDKPLGPTFTAFRDRYFEAVDYYQRVWKLKCCADCPELCDHVKMCPCHAQTRAKLRKRIAPFVYTRPASAPSRSPEVRVVQRKIPMPPAVKKISDKLMKELWAELPSGAELEALAASTVAGKLRQLAGGAVYLNPEPFHTTPEWESVHDAKLVALGDLLDELQGEPALVFYWFKHELARIRKAIKGRELAVYGEHPQAGALWNSRRLEVLLVHPQSAGFGLNLQKGGHHVIWFALPWSWELWKQGNGRVARPGQLAPWVTATQLLCGPADAYVAEALGIKGLTERDIMGSA